MHVLPFRGHDAVQPISGEFFADHTQLIDVAVRNQIVRHRVIQLQDEGVIFRQLFPQLAYQRGHISRLSTHTGYVRVVFKAISVVDKMERMLTHERHRLALYQRIVHAAEIVLYCHCHATHRVVKRRDTAHRQ